MELLEAEQDAQEQELRRRAKSKRVMVDCPEVVVEVYTPVTGLSSTRLYINRGLLGRGGFACVYDVQRLDDSQVFAAKAISKASLAKARSQQKLQSEISIHASLCHPHIVQFVQSFEDSANVYLLLERCNGATIGDMVKRQGPLAERDVALLVEQVLSALAYLHDRLIIHRDLKLSNLFLTDAGQVKLGDFGLACQLASREERKTTVCGTPNFIAPEVLRSKNGHGLEADIWSLGVVLYTMLVGRPPFETQNVKMTYSRIRANAYCFPTENPISPQATDLIRRMLRLQPELRPSLEEIRSHAFFTRFQPSLPRLLLPSSAAAKGALQPCAAGAQHSAAGLQQRPQRVALAEVQNGAEGGHGHQIMHSKPMISPYETSPRRSRLAQHPQQWQGEQTGRQLHAAGAKENLQQETAQPLLSRQMPGTTHLSIASTGCQSQHVTQASSTGPAQAPVPEHTCGAAQRSRPSSSTGSSSASHSIQITAVVTANVTVAGQTCMQPISVTAQVTGGAAASSSPQSTPLLPSTQASGDEERAIDAHGMAHPSQGGAILDRRSAQHSQACLQQAHSHRQPLYAAGRMPQSQQMHMRETLASRRCMSGAEQSRDPQADSSTLDHSDRENNAELANQNMATKRQNWPSTGNLRPALLNGTCGHDSVTSLVDISRVKPLRCRDVPTSAKPRALQPSMATYTSAQARQQEARLQPLTSRLTSVPRWPADAAHPAGTTYQPCAQAPDQPSSLHNPSRSGPSDAARPSAPADAHLQTVGAAHQGPVPALTASRQAAIPRTAGADADSVRVVRYLDLSNRYGLGYLLSDGTCGAQFNDHTSLVMPANAAHYWYVSHPKARAVDGQRRHDEVRVVSAAELDTELDGPLAAVAKKVSLLRHFQAHLGALPSLQTCEVTAQASLSTAAPCYVRKWLYTGRAAVFRLTTRAVQVTFSDGSEVLLSGSRQTVRYKAKGPNAHAASFALHALPSDSQLLKRLKYTRELLPQLVHGS